ncbi:MAG: HIT family protein, partial [Syntrophomonas sp.]
ELLEQCKQLLDKEFAPDGYNIGLNIGEAAGQTIFHVHMHLIPRYAGDVDNPRGGVRGVIAAKRIY